MKNVSRRRFLGACLGGLATAGAAAIAWPVYRFLAPGEGTETAAKVVIAEREVAEGEAKFFEFAGSTAVVVRKMGGGAVAFSAVCTHLGCIVQWEKEKQSFLCPCHAGRYAADGAVISGPPPKPLPKLPVAVENGRIIVG